MLKPDRASNRLLLAVGFGPMHGTVRSLGLTPRRVGGPAGGAGLRPAGATQTTMDRCEEGGFSWGNQGFPYGSLLVRVLDLALRDLFERHRQVVLRSRLDEWGQELVERAFAELVVVVVDLPGTLRGHDHEGVARVNVVEQFVDAGVDHGSEMVPAAAGTACGAALEAVRDASMLSRPSSQRVGGRSG